MVSSNLTPLKTALTKYRASSVCGMTYRRIVDDLGQIVVGSSSAAEADPRRSGEHTNHAAASCVNSSRDDSVDEEMHHYTRVRILAHFLLSNERQGTADTSNQFSDDEMSAMIGLDFCDDMAAMTDTKLTGVEKSERLNASAVLNERPSLTLPDLPLDISTMFPTQGFRIPQYGRGGRGLYWFCHSCHHLNNRALCPSRCGNCPHHSCMFCSSFW